MEANNDKVESYLYVDYVDFCPTIEARGFWMLGIGQLLAVTIAETQAGFIYSEVFGFGLLLFFLVARHEKRVQEKAAQTTPGDNVIKRGYR